MDNTSSFIETYTNIESAENAYSCLENINKPSVVLQMLQGDIGEKYALNCSTLRSLDEDHRTSLLQHCFTIDSPGKAEEKALLVF